MVIHDLYSRRQKRARGEMPDVYAYDTMPKPLRIQVVHIIKDLLDAYENPHHRRIAVKTYKRVFRCLCKVYGVLNLAESTDEGVAVFNFFLETKDVERCLDVIEAFFLEFNYIRNLRNCEGIRTEYLKPDDAINDINVCFKEHGIGYQFESGQIIKIESEILHSEVVKPTLAFLSNPKFKGPNEEFLKAHEHYRHGRREECISDSLKAFESVMKVICAKRRWKYESPATAKKLIDACIENDLIPKFLRSQFSSLQSLLESGVPTIRNRLAGHGQGTQTRDVPEHIASYALHLTATNILFLADLDKALR